MAKKITIAGANLLTDVTPEQPWGGVNNTQSAITVYGTTVPPGAEWGMNRDEVERAVKAKFGTKVGDFRFYQPDGENFFHLLLFATTNDAESWDEDHTKENYIARHQLPIAIVSGDSYVARLYSDRIGTVQYTVKDGGEFLVGVRFSALHIIAATSEQENMNGNGTLVIERSTDNQQTWTRVGTESVVSSDADATGYPKSVNIGKYMAAGRANSIRMRGFYTYTDSEGQQATMNSGYIVLNITSVTLAVTMMTDWSRPVMGRENAFPMSFAISGAVDKWLHVTVSGSLGTYSYVERISAATEYPTTSPKSWTEPEKSSIGILTHGIHTVTAWLTCDDGSGHQDAGGYPDAISSDVIVHRLMVVNASTDGAVLTTPRIMLQGVRDTVANYVRTVIAEYAVWIPDPDNPTQAASGKLPISIRITDSGEQDFDYTTVYAQQELIGENGVENGNRYVIDTSIEIEQTSGSVQPESYLSYLRIFRYDDGSAVNMLTDSIRRRFITITVDNRQNYAPTSGAYFSLNPRNRNNNEANPLTIINAQTGQAVPATLTGFGLLNDLWVTADDGQKVMRVLAGEYVEIEIDPWEQFAGSDVNAIRSAMSFELDFAVHNITQEDEPVVDITEVADGETLGMRMMPLEGWLKASERQATNDQDFAWVENKREHIVVTTDPAVVTRDSVELPWMQTLNNASSQPLPLAKVYINGYPERDMDYVLKEGSWASGNGRTIRIGNPHADIDIYGMKIYRFALSAEQAIQNFKASLPTAEEKQAMAARNDITSNGRIDYEKAKAKGYRCLTWVGQDQYKINQDKDTGYPGYWRIDHDNPAFGGTICKASYLASRAGTLGSAKCLMITAQGSTANTYYENNGQTKMDKVTYVIRIPFSKVHSDFGWTAAMSTGQDCNNPMWLNGERIEGTAYASLSDNQKAQVMIDVVDGWFDGNGWSEVNSEMGMYHGTFYTCYEGGAQCTKLVNKINYASPMQSHKMGGTRLYNDVMKTVTSGGMALHRADSGARFAVYEESFLYFTENPANEFKTEFHGMCTFGQGKFDKAAFGYKSNKNTFAFEGLNNNLPLCDFRVPADGDVTYNPDDEAWCYNGVKSFEYGLGKTVTHTDPVTGNVIKNAKGKDAEFPTDTNDAVFRRYVNFIYSHNTSLRYFNGTQAEFVTQYESLLESDIDAAVEMQLYQYWMVGSEGHPLLRYDYVRSEWIGAGTWNQGSDITGRAPMTYAAGTRDLSTYYMTSAAYTQWRNSDDYGNLAKLNNMYRWAIAQHAADNFGTVGHVENHKTHYNLVNFFLAGTDNCSKNLYYQYDPTSGLIFLDQDDVDSILPTDNNGRGTKVYFLDRMHDVDDYQAGYKPQIDYEGRASALFNLIETAYEEISDGLRQNMRTVLTSMAGLVDNSEGYGIGVMGCFNKYFLSTQQYFPQVAYAEQARIRYEFPKSFGYISFGNQARGIDPITQQVGSQQERELQYMRRRIAYVASFACWGDFSAGVNTGVVGLDDSGSNLAISPGSGRVGTSYVFTVTPHQWLYPAAAVDRAVADPHVRVAPGQPFTMDALSLAGLSSISGDSSLVLAALNYYRKIGNIGNMTVGNNVLNVIGTHLTEFVAEPSNPAAGAFAPGNIGLNAPNLQKLSLKGVSTMSGAKDFSELSRIAEMDLRGTNITRATMPQSQFMHTLQLPATTTALSLTAQPSLATLSLEGYAALSQLTITGCPLLASATRSIIEQMITAGAAATVIDINNIDWQAQTISTAMLRWLLDVGDNGTCRLAGRITMAAATATPSGRLYYNDVARLISRYGNIYDNTIAVGGTGLYVNFATTAVTESQMAIAGKKYINPAELEDKVISSGTVTGGYYDGLSLVISGAGNNVAAVQKTDGTWTPDVKWSIETTGMSSYVAIDDVYSSRLHVLLISQVTLVIRATLTDISGNERTTEKTIGLWRRVPQVGDYAWTDGEFDNEDDPSKVLAGMVVMRQMYTSDNVLTTFPAQAAWYKLWVLSYCGGTNASALNVTMIASSDGKSSQIGGTSTQCWGLYPDNSGNNGLPDTKQNGVYTNALLAKIAADTGRTDIFDVPNLTNLSGDVTLRKNAAAVTAAGGGVAMQDESRQYTEGEEVTGWAAVSQLFLNNFDSEGENSTLLGYADTVLQSVLDYFGIADSDLPADCKDSEGHTHPMTPRALADLTQMVVMYCIRDLLCTAFSESVTYSVGDHVIYNGGRYTCINAITTAGAWNAAQWEGFEIGDIDFSNADAASVASVSGKFRELMFPAARLCNVWCPADVQANAIAETDVDIQYRRGKWMLPSSALLARIFNFYGNSRAAYNTSSAAIASNADENALEAMLPLFSNAIARGRANGIPMSYSSLYWSPTETGRTGARGVYFGSGLATGTLKYTGIVVRPVAAFTFVP